MAPTWTRGDWGTGADDNGVNAVMLIDIARSFKTLGVVPRRTVRFVLFTGERNRAYSVPKPMC